MLINLLNELSLAVAPMRAHVPTNAAPVSRIEQHVKGDVHVAILVDDNFRRVNVSLSVYRIAIAAKTIAGVPVTVPVLAVRTRWRTPNARNFFLPDPLLYLGPVLDSLQALISQLGL